MQIAFHLGAHCTDEDLLLRALYKNRATLEPSGIVLPPQRLYRKLLPKVAKSLRGAAAEGTTRQVVLDAVLDDTPAERLIFSADSLLAFPVNAIGEDGLYPTAAQRVAAFANLFGSDQAEFFLGLRNPATLVPALLARLAPMTYDEVMKGVSPIALRWAPVIRRIVTQVPDLTLTIWCNEDTPLIWPELLRALAGTGPEEELEGDFDLLATILTDEGLEKLKAFLDTHPPANLAQRRRSVAAFLDKYARPDEMEVEIDLPGWSEELVAAMTDAYDADCAEIAGMPGVVFLSP